MGSLPFATPNTVKPGFTASTASMPEPGTVAPAEMVMVGDSWLKLGLVTLNDTENSDHDEILLSASGHTYIMISRELGSQRACPAPPVPSWSTQNSGSTPGPLTTTGTLVPEISADSKQQSERYESCSDARSMLVIMVAVMRFCFPEKKLLWAMLRVSKAGIITNNASAPPATPNTSASEPSRPAKLCFAKVAVPDASIKTEGES